MEKLISMTDFVISMREDKEKDNIRKFWACERYASFLKQPLTLGMFVPCDLDGNVLEEHMHIFSDNPDKSLSKMYQKQPEVIEYHEAKKRCLFEGFEVYRKDKFGTTIFFEQCYIIFCSKNTFLGKFKNDRIYNKNLLYTIEDLVKYNIILTPTALKQLGL